jgi:hypothetical protein
MSSLHILIVYTILTIIIADKKNIYFTQSIYDIWCQENILSNSLFLYPNRIPIGIYHRSNIKSVVYHLIDDNNNDLFSVKTKHLIDFYFCILNITRPLDINREYQDIYELHIQANIITNQGNFTEQAKVRFFYIDINRKINHILVRSIFMLLIQMIMMQYLMWIYTKKLFLNL